MAEVYDSLLNLIQILVFLEMNLKQSPHHIRRELKCFSPDSDSCALLSKIRLVVGRNAALC